MVEPNQDKIADTRTHQAILACSLLWKAIQNNQNIIHKLPHSVVGDVVTALMRTLPVELHNQHNNDEDADEELMEVFAHLQRLRDDLGHDHPSLPVVLRCVGSALNEREEHRRYAIAFLLEALRIEWLLLRDNGCATNIDIIMSLNAVGECFIGLGMLEEAAEFFDNATAIRERDFESIVLSAASEDGRTPSGVCFIFAVAAYNGGRTRFKMGHMEAAGRLFDDAIDLAKRIVRLPIDDKAKREDNDEDELATRAHRLAECGSLLHNIGQYKVEIGRSMSDAFHCFQDALRARRTALGRDHLDVAETLYELAALHHNMGEMAEALVGFKESLRIERMAYGNDHPNVDMTMHNIAQIQQTVSCDVWKVGS